MSAYWIAQTIGIVAFFIGITTFLHRNDRNFRAQLAVYSSIIGIHFFLLGANSAGISAIMNTFRTAVSMYTRNVIVMYIFIVVIMALGLYNLKQPIEILPIIGTTISTWALFKTQGLKTRYIFWCATFCWAIHNIWVGSIGGSLIECSFLLMNGSQIIRFRRMIAQGIDPFATVVKAP